MLEAAAMVSNGGFSSHSSQLLSCGDSFEEELSVLPRHTKVVVTGNNRTKSVLVGLQGVVKKAVDLGGWHWLCITDIPASKYVVNLVKITTLQKAIPTIASTKDLNSMAPPTAS